MAMHAQARWISEGNVGSGAQFFARANEDEFRLGLRLPVGLHPSWPPGPSEQDSQWGVGAQMALSASSAQAMKRRGQFFRWQGDRAALYFDEKNCPKN